MVAAAVPATERFTPHFYESNQQYLKPRPMMTRNELIKLLSIPEDSSEAEAMRREANNLSHKRFHDTSLLLGQIGVERHACPAACRFCSFSEDVFKDTRIDLDIPSVVEMSRAFCASGEVKALFLMCMHDFDASSLCKLVEAVRVVIPEKTEIVFNIGDCPESWWREFKAAGVSGAYHVLRLREGTDSQLNPADRKATIAAIRKTGLKWYYCCEPVGPEHTNEELADAILLGNEFGCFQHAAMARVNFPGSPLAQFGEISKRRLAQIVAAVSLASADNPELGSIAVHEPDMLGLLSGANSVYAECGFNPRDLETRTEEGRGGSVARMTAMLTEAGWRP